MNIRTMTRTELDWAVELAAVEGWNPGLEDADAFYAQDPQGFLIGEVEGMPVACISAVQYEGAFGFMGFYIVLPEFRGQGFGIQLWNAAVERLDGRVIGLDGVFAQQENYRKSGFDFAYRNIRYEFIVPESTEHVAQNSDYDREALLDYDTNIFSFPRPAFLRAWLDMPKAHKCILPDNKGGIAAFGVIRPCRKGWKIGPLFAETPALADACFRNLLSHANAGDSIYLDVPEVNAEAMALAQRYNMNEVFGTARMYNGTAPQLPTEKIFGVTTFELG